jgi:hypothetical protein
MSANTGVWKLLLNFKESERWGDSSKMNVAFLLKLDAYITHVKKAHKNAICVLTAEAWTDGHGHSDKSYHYLGRAVDCRFVDATTKKPLSLVDHLFIALKSPFSGVGIYTWSANGPYLHFDDRKESERKIWVCTKRGQYENLNAEFLREVFKL